MANFPIDPASFLPGQYEIIDVDGRPQQCRYHLSSPVPRKYEDVSLVSIDLALHAGTPFAHTRALLQNYFTQELGFRLETIHRCPIASAFIRLDSPSDRDWLIDQSPHNVNGITLSFQCHNAGINHRHDEYNRECWLMILAFPLDLWDLDHLKGAIKDFASLLVWDKATSNYGRVIIKVKLTDLNKVPYSCVVSSTYGSESWARYHVDPKTKQLTVDPAVKEFEEIVEEEIVASHGSQGSSSQGSTAAT
uniref:Uncharacterized protein n=1 Tax=Avena sativa TaxID=4498 RepID=A0ACD6ALI0_AVESA